MKKFKGVNIKNEVGKLRRVVYNVDIYDIHNDKFLGRYFCGVFARKDLSYYGGWKGAINIFFNTIRVWITHYNRLNKKLKDVYVVIKADDERDDENTENKPLIYF